MDSSRTSRIGADAVLFLSIIALPWWTSLALGTLFSFVFEEYYEGILGAVFADLLYATGGSPGFHNPFEATLSAVCIFTLARILRARLISLTE